VSLEKTLNAVSHLEAKQSTRCGVPTQRKAYTEQRLCWSGMTDTEHTTSGSNAEDHDYKHVILHTLFCDDVNIQCRIAT